MHQLQHNFLTNKEVMMKTFLIALSILSSVSVFASVDLTCKSQKYTVIVHDIGGDSPSGNYKIYGKMNEGADVIVGPLYFSDRVIALSLSVDGVLEKFEVSAVNTKAKTFSGVILTGKQSQKAICVLN
jgi:hypothetical protein